VQTTSAVLKKDQAEQAALGDGLTFQAANMGGDGVDVHRGGNKRGGPRKDAHLDIDVEDDYAVDKRGSRTQYGPRGGKHHYEQFENAAYQKSHARHSLPHSHQQNKQGDARHSHQNRGQRIDFYHQDRYQNFED